MSIPNSTGLSTIEIASANTGRDLNDPELDASTGQIYALSTAQGTFNNVLTSVNTTSLSARTVLRLPDSALTLAVDPKTHVIFVQILGCNEGVNASNNCRANQSGFYNHEILRVNGSTYAIEGRIPIRTNDSFMAVNPNTGILYAIQTCPGASTSSPCGHLLAFDESSGALAGNLTLKAFFDKVVVNSVTNTIYIKGSWAVQSLPPGSPLTQGVIAVSAVNLRVNYTVPLNFTNTVDLSLNEVTNAVYAFADNMTGSKSSANLVMISGTSGRVIFSTIVGTACSISDDWGSASSIDQGATVNTSTNQLYLYTGDQSQSSLVVLDGNTGQVVGMLSATLPIQTSIFDSVRQRVYVILPAPPALNTTVAVIPSTLMQGNVSPAILNATCPPPPLPLR
jgi:hypothetical protein